MARRAGTAARRHPVRHAGFRDAWRPAFHAGAGRRAARGGHRGQRAFLEIGRRPAVAAAVRRAAARGEGALQSETIATRASRGQEAMVGNKAASPADAVLVGAGIMSTTLAVLLKELQPSLRVEIVEELDGAALESSNAWNNAGTGHAANCELNYTPMRADGSIDISKALEVNVEFDLSRQLWSYLVKKGAIADPQSFIHAVPHMSFVRAAGRHA